MRTGSKARWFLERLLFGQADFYTDPNLPSECLLIQSSMSTSSEAACRKTSERRHLDEMAVCQRLLRAKKEHELPPGVMPEQLAAYVTSIGNGLAIRAADGAKREELYHIIDLALAFWPKTPDKATAIRNRSKSLSPQKVKSASPRMTSSKATKQKRK